MRGGVIIDGMQGSQGTIKLSRSEIPDFYNWWCGGMTKNICTFNVPKMSAFLVSSDYGMPYVVHAIKHVQKHRQDGILNLPVNNFKAMKVFQSPEDLSGIFDGTFWRKGSELFVDLKSLFAVIGFLGFLPDHIDCLQSCIP